MLWRQDKLNSIKRLNDSFGGKQLLFYTLEGGDGAADASGALDMSSSLLEAIVQMLNAPSAYERLPVGTHVTHPKRGHGVIEEILPDLRRAVRFDDGDMHRYKPESLYKLLDNLEKDKGLTDAAKEAERQALSKTLGLTVVWDRPELARKILASIQMEEPGAMREVCDALQRAIGLHRQEVTRTRTRTRTRTLALTLTLALALAPNLTLNPTLVLTPSLSRSRSRSPSP